MKDLTLFSIYKGVQNVYYFNIDAIFSLKTVIYSKQAKFIKTKFRNNIS